MVGENNAQQARLVTAKACWSSERVFITNGPYIATGSLIGRPPSSSSSTPPGMPRILVDLGPDGQRVARGQHRQLPLPQRLSARAHGGPAAEVVDQRVVLAGPGQSQLGARMHGGVHQGDRGVRRTGAGLVAQLAGDDAQQAAAVVGGDQRDPVRGDVMIPGSGRLTHS
jgi:hypothetical protein